MLLKNLQLSRLGCLVATIATGAFSASAQDIPVYCKKQYSWGGYASTDFRLVPEEGLFQIVVRQRVPSAHGLAGRLFPIVYRGVK